jgi:hypothetical protein
MDDSLLLAFAREANTVSFPIERVTAAAGIIRHINRIVADAALRRVGVTCHVEAFDSFRAQCAAPDKTDAE